MSEIKNIPRLRFPDFENDWALVTINDLISKKILDKPIDGNHGNIHPKSSDYVEEGIPFLMANDINDGKLDIENSKNISDSLSKTLQKGFSIEGDVLLTHKATIGESAIVPKLHTKYIVLTPQVTYYRILDSTKYLNIFLLQVFRREKFIKSMKTKAGGAGGVRLYIGITEQRNLEIPLVSISEQQKIASFLTSVDDKINLLTKKKELLEQYKKGVMQKIFSQEIRFKDDNGNNFPDWVKGKLSNYIKVKGGFAFKSLKFKKNGVPVIRISNISNNTNKLDLNNLVFYEELENDKSFTIKRGDLLIALSGATTGKSSISDLEGKAYLNQRVGLFKITNDNLDYGFLVQFVFGNLFQKELKKVLVAGAQPNISTKDIEMFSFISPCKKEQIKISGFLSSLDKKIELVNSQIDKTKEFKKGLLQQMFV